MHACDWFQGIFEKIESILMKFFDTLMTLLVVLLYRGKGKQFSQDKYWTALGNSLGCVFGYFIGKTVGFRVSVK